ncbi:hypothetical protein QJS10_CPB04g01298 [Acorus calamus]|uniref:Uncharacterized protein n=1 Tax=Acorus calamus TaxID=4465 RepID=A0AAV9EZD7_ACOCL|nr:hypothetical protein QJS10_CPB04g01298 [Acorus calamus]
MESDTVQRLLQTTLGSYASLHRQSACAGSNGGAYENTCFSQWLVRKVLEEGHFLLRNKTLEAPITPLTAKMSIIFGVVSGIKLSIAHEATKIWSESDSITAIAWSQGREINKSLKPNILDILSEESTTLLEPANSFLKSN